MLGRSIIVFAGMIAARRCGHRNSSLRKPSQSVNLNANGFGGPEVYHKFEIGRLHHGQTGRLSALPAAM
jgi:hypothetical protein